MAYWSAENATNAYLKTISTNKERRSKEPDVAEYISALAAGNNAQLMILTCATNDASSITTLLALIAASQQTGGRVICILPTLQQLDFSELQPICHNENNVEFVTGGDPQTLITSNHYRNADFVLIDCNLDNHQEIIMRMQNMSTRIVVGYNAFCKGSSREWSGLKTHLLPIGAGLLVTKINEKKGVIKNTKDHCGTTKKSRWIVKVDKCTGEEHVFRVRRHPKENYNKIKA